MVKERPIISNPKEHIGKLCHVDGWPRGCVFVLKSTDGNTHDLVTPKSGRRYRVTKSLRHTKRQANEIEVQEG
jgi:hypothetical protein